MIYVGIVMKNKSGFTLVELSIVIVIIGLIVAGVVGGQALVRQAKLRATISDIDKYRLAHNAFILEYDAIPGDFDNAHSFWGNACDASAANCNGDGNGHIQDTECAGLPATNEIFRYWQHLQLAGIINTSLTGQGVGAATRGARPGINVPELPIQYSVGKGGVGPRFDVVDNGNKTINTNVYFIGAEDSTRCVPVSAFFTTKDALQIDTKIDEGTAHVGDVTASNHGGT